MRRIFKKKCIHAALECAENDKTLKRSIGPAGLTIMGVGGIIGAGIFIVTGVASAASGPALMISFMVAAIACTFTALCYAEFASMIPIAGSVYTYTYITMGEIWAWIMGWIMILQYLIASAAVAIGWSSYVVAFLTSLGLTLPSVISGPLGIQGSLINIPAVIIIVILTGVLIRGAQESARVNAVIVFIKIAVILLFITIGINYINPANYHPFMPYGISGIFTGAAMVFFAYLGFDAVASAAEETKDPGRTIPIGIIGSLIISSILYIAVAAIMTGMVPFDLLNNASPVAYALQYVGVKWAFTVITIGAIAGLTTVVLVNMFSKARIIFAMSRDGLLPKLFSNVNQDCKAPVASIILVGGMAALIAAFFSLDSIFELVNVGALSAFIFLALSVIILRRQQPNMKRAFKCPLVPAIPILSIIFCLALISQLKVHIIQIFIVWLILGVIVYFIYGKYRGMFKTEDILEPDMGDLNRLLKLHYQSRFTKIFLTNIILVVTVAAFIAAFVPLALIIELVNIGTLSAFIFPAISVIVLRRSQPDIPRGFKCPLVPIVSIISIISCLFLITQLSSTTLQRFANSLIIVVSVYFLYGMHRSKLNNGEVDDLNGVNLIATDTLIETEISRFIIKEI